MGRAGHDSDPAAQAHQILAAQARVERVAQPVADEIEAEHRDHDGQARDGRHVRRHQQQSRPVETMSPHDGVGGCTPSPRNDSAASSRMALAMKSVA